jgi:hypothetical protein
LNGHPNIWASAPEVGQRFSFDPLNKLFRYESRQHSNGLHRESAGANIRTTGSMNGETLARPMFPSEQDLEAFRAEFGPESILHRLAIPRQSYCGTQAAVVIAPEVTKDATLARAWEIVRAVARWLLGRAAGLPANERYEIIVGWSQSVRKLQGQIFKTGGESSAIQTIADSTQWAQCGRAPLHRWEKDVFEKNLL